MPRQPRLDAPGTLHHIIGRGIERTKIFRKEEDRLDFLERLSSLCHEEALNVYAWALMSKHFHLLVRTGRESISYSMRKILTGYVVNFNRRYKRNGHLFQNRYKSIICEDDPYLLELTRYIHLNPLRAGVITSMKELKKYPWTGHSAIMGKIEREWQDIKIILAYFDKSIRKSRAGYENFVKEGESQGRRPDLGGGGLLRSFGGWTQVVSLRRKEIKSAYDERILGSSDFVSVLLREAEQKEKETLRLSSTINDLASLARKVIKCEGVKESGLRSGSRKKEAMRARRLFCQLAVKKLGYYGAEVARYLGITTSAVNRRANSEELPDVKKYL